MGIYTFQGVIGYIFANSTGSSLVPLFRLHNSLTDTYVYTSNYAECVSFANAPIPVETDFIYTDHVLTNTTVPTGILQKNETTVIGFNINKYFGPGPLSYLTSGIISI